MGRFKEISDNDFKNVVLENFCIRDVVGALGYSRSSGSMATLVKNRIKEMHIDTSHFREKERQGIAKYGMKDVLIENSKYENINRLKRRIIKEKLIEYKCEKCENPGIWQEKELVLQLEHKNGIHNDHRIENLCFLCPNCHSQTSTFSGRNKGKYNNSSGDRT